MSCILHIQFLQNKPGAEDSTINDFSTNGSGKPIVDINDVEVTLLPYENGERSEGSGASNQNLPQGDPNAPALPPKRPARVGKEGKHVLTMH